MIRLIFLLTVFLFACGHKSENADLVVHNGKIFSCNPGFETYQAMAIIDGKIVDVGPEREILNKYAADKYIDLAKSNVYPVFPNEENPEKVYCKLINGAFDGFEMSAKDALLECTSFAALDFGIDSSGTLEVGKSANFFISDSDLSSDQSSCSFRINETYINGKIKN